MSNTTNQPGSNQGQQAPKQPDRGPRDFASIYCKNL